MSETILRSSDRTPSFTVLAGSAEQIGSRVEVTDLDSGASCDTTVGTDMLASCIFDRALDYGSADIEALVWNSDRSEHSDPSESFTVKVAYAEPTVRLDSYDTDTNKARVSGFATGPEVDVQNGSAWHTEPVDQKTGAWSSIIDITDPTGPITASVSVDNVASAARTWLPGQQPDTPSVTTTVAGTKARLHIAGADDSHASIEDASGRVIGGGHLVGGEADIIIPIPTHESHFAVTVQHNRGPESEPADVVVNEGVGQAEPNRPTVGSSAVSGARAIVSVSGDRGATVVVKSLDGTPLATRVLGSSGVARVAIPMPDARDSAMHAFSAQQTSGGSTSPVTVFTVDGSGD